MALFEETQMTQGVVSQTSGMLGQTPTPPREPTMKERTMQHDQRISLLERQVAHLEQGIKELLTRLVQQVGLDIE